MARRTGRRTDYEWAVAAGLVTAIDLDPTASSSPGAGAIAAIDVGGSGTITRIRGEVFGQLDAGAVDERAVLACGLLVMTDDAVTAGAFPEPSTDGSLPWIWHGFLTLSSGAGASAAEDAGYDRLTLDSKAMRRVKAGEQLIFLADCAASLDQAGTADVMYGIRVLFGS